MTHRVQNKLGGFTLIEVVIYLALYSLIMGGVVVAAYEVFESSGRSNTRAMIQEDGNFIVAKIDWALSGVQLISTPAATGTGACTKSTTLSVAKWNTAVGVIEITPSIDGDVLIQRMGTTTPVLPLNNANTKVSGLEFTRCTKGGMNPESVETRFTLTARAPNGMAIAEEFYTSSYIRR